jgi:hypothetical protein
VSHEIIPAPSSRTWRDIPQPIKPRVMSRGGRWRLTLSTVKTAIAAAMVAGAAFGTWKVVEALQDNSDTLPAVAKKVPVRAPELVTDRGGVLGAAWLGRTLALPKNISLAELDLEKLRARVLGDRQVVTANLRRVFPDRLVVEISERLPVARIMAELRGEQLPLLVARDGVLFAGDGFDPAMIATLPWLDGTRVSRDREGFRPIEGMDRVADLLAQARFEAPHLYESWRVVSLARLASDREIEVRTMQGFTVIFGAGADFFRQLAKLDYLWEKIANVPATQARIDLSLGQQVPVLLEVAPPAEAPRVSPQSTATAIPLSFVLPSLSSKTNREL